MIDNPATSDFVNTPLTEQAIEDRDAYDRAMRFLKFTRDVNDSLDAIIRNESLKCEVRFLAWVKRCSWGSYSLYAIRADGQPAMQSDCARDLNVSRQAVSVVVSFYQDQGLLEKAKRLVPVVNPKPPSKAKVVKDAIDKLEFEKWWSVNHAIDKAAYDEAEAEFNRQRKCKRAIEKKFMTSRTNEPPFLIESLRVNTEEDAAHLPAVEPLSKPSATSSSVSSELTTTIASVAEIKLVADEPDEPEQVLAAMNEHSKADPDAARRMIAACREFAPDATAEYICRHIDAKGLLARRATNPVGFLLTVVPKTFEGWRKPPGHAVSSHSDEELERIRSDTDRKLAAGGD